MEEKSTFEGKGVKGVANYYLTHTKKYKAITLVALIITVIVLLILTGVTLNITLGENGIFSQSKIAVQKYENEKLKEEQELQNAANSMLALGVVSHRDNSDKEPIFLTRNMQVSSNENTSESWQKIQDTISLDEYGTGIAIISYSVTSGNTVLVNQLCSAIAIDSNRINYDVCSFGYKGNNLFYGNGASTSNSAIFRYNENTKVDFEVWVRTKDAANISPMYGYSICLIPD